MSFLYSKLVVSIMIIFSIRTLTQYQYSDVLFLYEFLKLKKKTRELAKKNFCNDKNDSFPLERILIDKIGYKKIDKNNSYYIIDDK